MRAIALSEGPDHVSARYRIKPFAAELERAGCSLEIAPLPRRALERLPLFARLHAFDVVLLQRRLLPLPELMYLRHRARRLVYDFDDAMLYRDSYHPRGHQSRQRARRFKAAMRFADAVIAGNSFLKQCAISSGAMPEAVHIVPTCVEPENYPVCSPSRAEGMEMVWIGSSSTLAGLELRRPLLQRMGRELPGLRLRVICDKFPRFDPLPVIATAWAQATEAAFLARADIGISWMPDDIWSRGKCGLKVLQYGAARLPTIANLVGVQGEIIRDGVNGFLARTDDEWIAALRRLMANPALGLRMGEQARAMVEQSYSVKAHAGAFVSIVIAR